MSDHHGQVIPVPDKRDFAYQNEHVYPGGLIESRPTDRGPKEESEKYISYEFRFHKNTDTSLVMTLRKYRRDTVQMRKKNGAAVIYEEYQTSLSFAEFMNRIFSPGCDVYLEGEAFPPAIKEAMKTAYDPRPDERS